VATIHDVAARAGVSVKTVSRYLSGYKGVSPKTVARIEKAAAELAFAPSAAARSLRGAPSGIVCLITDNLTTTPFSFDIVKGVQAVCEAQHKLLLIGETRGSTETFERLMNRFRQQKAEAIVSATFFHKEVDIPRAADRCPLVLVNCFDTEGRHPSVVPDDEQGSYDLTRRLIGLGHRDIAFITLPSDLVATTLRDQGFRRALREAGLAIHEPWVIRSGRLDAEPEAAWLAEVLTGLLSGGRRPSAIMCGNDKMAFQVMMRLQAMGHALPHDVSVVGFDDYRLISENTVPPLTTASLPYHEMGVRAAELALAMAQDGVRTINAIRCRCELVARGSDRALGLAGAPGRSQVGALP